MGLPGEGEDVGLIAYKKLIGLLAFLDTQFPAYPPLRDFVAAEGVNDVVKDRL